MQLQRILVALEPDSKEQPALEKAARLATLTGAEIELFLAEFNAYLADGYYFEPVQARQLRQEHGERRMQELEAFAQPLREQGLSVSVATAWGNPAYAEILDRAASTQPSLLIKATRHHNKVARLLLAHTDWELVRQCPVPLLLVKNDDWPARPHIVASVDPNHINDKPAELDDVIIAAAQQMTAFVDGELKVFHAAGLPPLAGLYPLHPDTKREASELHDLAKKHGLGEASCVWSLDRVEEALPALVDTEQASLVVMGAISRSRMEQALVGTTASRLLDELHCDVLVVRPTNTDV